MNDLGKTAFLINFDKTMPETVIEDLKASYKEIENVVSIQKKVSINLSKKNIYIQCVDIRRELEVENPGIFDGISPVIINLPGFAIAAVYIVNEIEARMKRKPLILEMIKSRNSDNLFTEFQFRRLIDLQLNNKITKNNIE